MRTCIVCKLTKDESEFGWRNKNKNLLQSVCDSCRRKQMKDRYQKDPDNVREINKSARLKTRSEAQAYLLTYFETHPCVDCGETDPIVLTFDHVTGIKKHNLADMVTHGHSLSAIQEEISKCEVRCYNCHMRAEHLRRRK